MRYLKTFEDGNVDLGEIPGMGDSDRFPGETIGYKNKTLDGAAGSDKYLPTDYIEDPDDAKKKKKGKNIKGYVDWIDSNKNTEE